MKNIYTLLFLLVISFSNAQTNGITYQAVMLKPGGSSLPGVNNPKVPLVKTKICLRFNFLDVKNELEYQERIITTTDDYGMVNLVIGNGLKTGGYSTSFSGIVWNGTAKNLAVEVDILGNCTNYLEMTNQPFTAVPYALFAANSGTPGPIGPQGIAGIQGPIGVSGQIGLSGLQV
jgi:hypothetical protein